MLAVDTNIIVRYLVCDHPGQSAKARLLIDGEDIFVPTTVLLEAEWVLRSVYGLNRREAAERLRAVAGLPQVSVEAPAVTAMAFEWALAGLDFADAIHLAASRSCAEFLSFDRDFLKSAAKLPGVNVRAP